MKKIILFLLLFMAAALYCRAQNSNDMQARFKFQDAQTAYDNGDYSTTLSKLGEVQKLLGNANPKILYLRIMAEYKSIDFADEYANIPLLRALKKNADAYMQKYVANAGEDKARDLKRGLCLKAGRHVNAITQI